MQGQNMTLSFASQADNRPLSFCRHFCGVYVQAELQGACRLLAEVQLIWVIWLTELVGAFILLLYLCFLC